MQDLSSAIKALKDATDSIKAGGWMAVAVLVVILAFLLLKPIIARGRKATTDVSVEIGKDIGGGTNGSGKTCPLHSGIEVQLKAIEKQREENSTQHQKLFDGLQRVEVNIASLTAAIKK